MADVKFGSAQHAVCNSGYSQLKLWVAFLCRMFIHDLCRNFDILRN